MYRLTSIVKSYALLIHSRQKEIYMFHVFKGVALVIVALVVFGVGTGVL